MSPQQDTPYAALLAPVLDGLVVGIDHIGICVADIDEAERAWTNLLGRPAVDREDVAPQKTTASFIRMHNPSEASVEFVCPMPGNIGLHKFVHKRGDAMHHLAFAVTDIREALARLKKAEVPLIDSEPRPGAGGHLVAFLHPKAMAGTLVELVERSEH